MFWCALPWWGDTHTAGRCAWWHHPAVPAPLSRCPCQLSEPDPQGLSKKKIIKKRNQQDRLEAKGSFYFWAGKKNFCLFKTNSKSFPLTFKFPLLFHIFHFDLEEVEELCRVGHPEHEGPQVGWQLLDIRRAYLPFLFCGTAHTSFR